MTEQEAGIELRRRFSDPQWMKEAFDRAVKNALLEHARAGNPIAEWDEATQSVRWQLLTVEDIEAAFDGPGRQEDHTSLTSSDLQPLATLPDPVAGS